MQFVGAVLARHSIGDLLEEKLKTFGLGMLCTLSITMVSGYITLSVCMNTGRPVEISPVKNLLPNNEHCQHTTCVKTCHDKTACNELGTLSRLKQRCALVSPASLLMPLERLLLLKQLVALSKRSRNLVCNQHFL